MNGDQINHAIRRHVSQDIFNGVFSADNLPTNPHLLVCNTDPSHKEGQHWIAIYVDKQRRCGEYFDSFGRRPSATFKRYMNEHCKHWTFNDKQLQSAVSFFCGQYCVFYCIMRSRDIDMRRIVSSFTRDYGFNDVVVHGFICHQ